VIVGFAQAVSCSGKRGVEVIDVGGSFNRHPVFMRGGRVIVADPKKALLTRERTLHTHAELWHASKCVLEAGQKRKQGCVWQFLSSVMLTAFAFEAYLNHLGPKVIATWDELDRLAPLSKLDVLAELLSVALPPKGARPLSTMIELFKFRNQVAHGKTIRLKPREDIVDADEVDELTALMFPQSFWEALIQDDAFAVRVREDAQTILKQLHEKSPEPRGLLFGHGFGFGSATVIDPKTIRGPRGVVRTPGKRDGK
jgi:hypothetical protein